MDTDRIIIENGEMKYDFGYLLKGLSSIYDRDAAIRSKARETIIDELNKFFTDIRCSDVKISDNTDNDFFGVQIIPYFRDSSAMASQIMNPDMFNTKSSEIKFDHYALDIDSKVFDEVYEFSPLVLAALIIHDINAINNPQVVKDFVAAIDYVSVKSGVLLRQNDIQLDQYLMQFVMTEYVRKVTSSFELCNENLVLADDFIRNYGLTEAYDRGIECVKKAKNNLKDQICCPTLIINWYLSVYRYSGNPFDQKTEISDVIEDSVRLCGSRLLRKLMVAIVDYNNASYDRNIRDYRTALTESSKKKSSLFTQIKKSGMKSIEDDVYEYRIRIKNIQTEYEALNLMRELNGRMVIITDYLDNEEELSEHEKERLYKLYDKYDNLREELSKQPIYNRKMYGLFVDYNALKQMSDANMTTMNTYY